MTTPQRIQCKRTAGWRMPDGAVYVGRPSRWGNPFQYRQSSGLVRFQPSSPGIWEYESRISAHGMQHNYYDTDGTVTRFDVRYATRAELVELFRRTLFAPDRGMLMGYPSAKGNYTRLTVEQIVEGLRGADLACWCLPRYPCHADVLLELANR